MDWKEKIEIGMKLIIDGCQNNPSWTKCRECPFDTFCSSIWSDKEHNYTTPDTWEQEGVFEDEEETI